MRLGARTCTPYRSGVSPLGRREAERLLADTPGWTLDEAATRIARRFTCPDFSTAMQLAVRVGALADAEGHHPDITVGWGYCAIVFYTHTIRGLHENDFIMAAKVNDLAAG